MQTGRTPAQDATISKSKLFAAILVGVFAILSLPIILPHLTHPSMIYHILLHVFSLTIAAFLSVVSILAYRRTQSMRILLMTFGFLSLLAVESISLLAASENITLAILPDVNIELSHILLFVVLALFGLGVLKVDK